MSRRGHKKSQSSSAVCLSVAEWPEADKVLWARARRAGDVLDVGGRASKWAPRTVRNVENVYGHWLKWLRDVAVAPLDVSPLDRVTREQVGRYIGYLQVNLAPFTVQIHLQRLGQMMVAFTETKEFGWLFRAANRLKPATVRNKRVKLQPSYALAELGMRLMRDAETMEDSWHSPPAVMYRDGLIIALLAYRPMRLNNLVNIRVGRHLQRSGNNFSLAFGAEETKQREALRFDIPQSLTPFLHRYLVKYRPALLANAICDQPAGDSLWVSRDGGSLTAEGIRRVTNRHTSAEFGSGINPHLFRDCAATTVAIEDPGHVSVIPGVLGHSSMATSEKHYNQAQMIDAAQRYHTILQSRRRRRTSAVI